jgi:hypothetical protein
MSIYAKVELTEEQLMAQQEGTCFFVRDREHGRAGVEMGG